MTRNFCLWCCWICVVLVAKMTHIFCILQYHVYIYITERWATFFSVCRTGRQRLDERGVSPRGERHFCSVCRATWGYLWERTAATGIFENLISGAIWGYLWEPATGILGNRISGAIWGYLHKKIICIKKCSDVLIYIHIPTYSNSLAYTYSNSLAYTPQTKTGAD